MSSSGSKAAKAGIAYTIGNVGLKGVAFITLPIFSRLLTTDEFGLYNLYVSYETILTIFVGLCLYGSLRTGKYDYKNNFDDYVSSTITLSLIVFIGMLLLGNIIYPFISSGFEFNRFILNLLIVHSYAMFIFQFYNVRLALDFRYKEYIIASGVNSIGGTVLSIILILCLFDSDKHIARIYGYASVPILVASIIWISFIRNGVKHHCKFADVSQWKYALGISLPLAVHTFSQQILNQFDRIMIGRLVNTAAVGIYSFIYTIGSILQVIVQSMDNAWSVWMYEQLEKKNYDAIKLKSSSYILLMNTLYIGFIALVPDVIRIAGTEDYYEGISMVIPIAFAIYFIFLYSLPVHIEYFNKQTKFIASGTSLAAVINLILNYIFILKYGYQAAAWTTLVSYILLFVFHFSIARRIDRNSMFPIKMIIFSIGGLIVYSGLILLIVNYMLIRWLVMIFVLIAMFVICRKVLLPMLEMVPALKKFIRR